MATFFNEYFGVTKDSPAIRLAGVRQKCNSKRYNLTEKISGGPRLNAKPCVLAGGATSRIGGLVLVEAGACALLPPMMSGSLDHHNVIGCSVPSGQGWRAMQKAPRSLTLAGDQSSDG
jgi:hypothetical protein